MQQIECEFGFKLDAYNSYCNSIGEYWQLPKWWCVDCANAMFDGLVQIIQ